MSDRAHHLWVREYWVPDAEGPVHQDQTGLQHGPPGQISTPSVTMSVYRMVAPNAEPGVPSGW